MARLEDLTKGALVRGVLAERAVRVVDVDWHGSSAITLTYTDDTTGRPNQELLYRDDEARLSVEQAGRAWSMDADGRLFRLVSEAKRISLAYLFDPFLAVQTSNLEPLPHQIDAVYNQMLPRQPLRYLLADDPGAGKTIMAGLFCKELMIRGDVERCLVIAPGSLVDQWQDELWSKFGLNFEILTKDMIESARSGNPFAERPLLIARLDHLSRNEDLQAKLEATDWDLVIADEAHKMSAHYVGGEVKETKRYKLGRLAGSVARHLLLMTATPHAGIEEDFHLFLALLDGDRFEGKPRRAAHAIDTSDLMRRLVKERLLKFDGTPLFPERRSYTAIYPLSDGETLLYKRVTEYVTEEMNRAERLKAEGEGRRGTVVGFALTTLQRRLASSPEAIYQSLVRRRRRLENRIAEERLRKRGAEIVEEVETSRAIDHYRIDDDFDLDDLAEVEREELEEELVDQASAARTIAELEYEIATLADLAVLAGEVRSSGTDRKWEELSRLLQHTPEMFDAHGNRRKLIVFSEHRDTLNYLVDKLRLLLGRDEAVVTIHGGLPREERRKVQEAFVQDKDVLVLVATDAAGEGINLQRAHLMVNYDLPWNPNRIEQRFGRVHRIGQTEVCHLWNLMAEDTREGQVFQRLFAKLEEQRRALGDQVFDVLGESFRGKSLRDLLIEAVRYGEQPLVRARLSAVVDATVGDALQEVIHDRALVTDVMTGADVERIRDEMERAEARKLQPHFVRDFFLEAFALLGGSMRQREPGRFEITHVPAELRRRDRQIGLGAPLLRRYERVTFEKSLIAVEGRPIAEYLTPGHPLLDGAIDLIIERYDALLRQGAVLIDEADAGDVPRVLVYLHHSVVDGRADAVGNRRVVSKRFEFVAVDPVGVARPAGWAPYLDCRPATPDELTLLTSVIDGEWVRADLETNALDHGVKLARGHLDEVRRRTLDRVERTVAAVRERLQSEIQHWDHRANQLKDKELAGKLPRSGMNSAKARQRADELEARLKRRIDELDAQRQLAPMPPVVAGGALIVPAGLLASLEGTSEDVIGHHAAERAATERAAVDAVLAAERRLGRNPQEMPPNNKGYDIESREHDGTLLFIEVKGRVAGADTFTVTRSEIGVGRNQPDRHVLALVAVGDGVEPDVRYLRRAFDEVGDLPFDSISVNFKWKPYFDRGQVPA
ncbi:MAG TPA: helicase-related protein [Acidimicrobiales bacterium]|nr:helicase-related protein [Acidimicrobiales bacterium]